MSAKPCNRCGGLIVFGTEQETGRVIPLMVGGEVYRIVKDAIVTRDTKALIRHVCHVQPRAEPQSDFREPKEPAGLVEDPDGGLSFQ